MPAGPPADAFTHVCVDNTLIAVWHGDPTLDALRVFGNELTHLADRNPAGIYILNVITEATGMPDNAARALLQSQFQAMRGRVTCAAIVLEKRGIMGSLSRAILTTLLTVTRRPFEMGIHDDRLEATRWLSRRAQAPQGDRLLRALNELSRLTA